ncbi:MAG: hypothetical protein ACYC4R_07465 [Anaerolineae bacterium]
MALSYAALLDGKSQRPPSPLWLRAGPLSMRFDPDTAYLRRIRLGEREVLRGLYVAVRDPQWATVQPEISNLRVEPGDDSFRLRFDAACRQGKIDFTWKGEITGAANGTITYRMEGIAHTAFWRNRIGICALHPIEECAGQPCTVEKVDGGMQQGAFPARDDVAPHQPFFEIRAITHTILSGVHATLRLEGDTFEMEDQRNWTDASFKTYSTPLSLPMPVGVAAGTRIVQTATLSITGTPEVKPTRVRLASEPQRIIVGGIAIGKMPQIGLQMSSLAPLTDQTAERLRVLRLHHLRVDLHLIRAAWRQRLQAAAKQAQALGCALEVGLHLGSTPEQELAALAEALRAHAAPVAHWLVFREGEMSVPVEWVRLAQEALGERAVIGAGSSANYAELNRNRPHAEGLALVCYPMTPQRHLFDNDSLVETLPMQAETVRHARVYTCPAGVVITPITLRPPAKPGQDPEVVTVDPRQASLFGAAWTLGSLASLAEALPYSITYYEALGPRGVMAGAEPVRVADDTVPAGDVFPLYHVLADVGAFAGQDVLPTVCEDPLALAALALARGEERRLLIANLTPSDQRARLEGVQGVAQVRLLDADSAPRAMAEPEAYRIEQRAALAPSSVLTLPPYALVCVDWLVTP